MFSADAYLVEFMKSNWISISIVLGFLKLLATRSETTLDDSLIGYLGQSLTIFKKDKPSDVLLPEEINPKP